jgi:hypothetical protein
MKGSGITLKDIHVLAAQRLAGTAAHPDIETDAVTRVESVFYSLRGYSLRGAIPRRDHRYFTGNLHSILLR